MLLKYETYGNKPLQEVMEAAEERGKKLAEELGIHCYDRELIRMASDESGINEALFGEADETA